MASDRKFKGFVKGLHRTSVDLVVETSFYRPARSSKKHRQKSKHRTARFRVVGVRHPVSDQLHFYVTNVPAEMMSPKQIQAAYTARWMVELVFDELKNDCGMTAFPSRRPEVVSALITASAIRLMTSRAVFDRLKSRCIRAARAASHKALAATVANAFDRRTSPKRFSRAWKDIAPFLLPDVLAAAGISAKSRCLERVLIQVMVDPNRNRDSLRGRLWAA